MTASMIDPITDFNCIHPHEVLRLIIPHRVKLLLAYWTRLVSESRVRGSGNMLLLWISSRKGSGQCGFDCRRGSICERSIFRVVARPDPLLAQTSINAQRIPGGLITYQFIDVPTPALPPLGRLPHALICPKMPVQMSGLLFAAFICSQESSTAR